jgi:hypothetical protein
LDRGKVLDPARPRNTVIVLLSKTLLQPVVQKMLQTKIDAVDDDRFAGMCHVILLFDKNILLLLVSLFLPHDLLKPYP